MANPKPPWWLKPMNKVLMAATRIGLIMDGPVVLTVTGRTLRPESTYVQVAGSTLTVTIRFPRTKPITLGDKQVDFVGHGGPLKFNQRFRLKSMMYGGKLEL